MTDPITAPEQPTECLLQAWIYRPIWTAEEAILLALDISPEENAAREKVEHRAPLLELAKRDGMDIDAPKEWLWWGEKNGMPYHTEWWLGVTPEGPIGFDGRHFALLREEMQSNAYLQQERNLITSWAKKPYWTPREAIDLSLNFRPFSTDGWRGEAPEAGETIREREDRFLMLERAVEAGDISERASPRDYIRWFDKCRYIVSEAWRRAMGLTSAIGEQEKLSALVLENESLRRDLKAKSELIEGLQVEANSISTPEIAEELEELRAEIKRLKADPENPREKGAMTRRISSLQKALLSAAVDCYSYDPRHTKSDAARHISAKSNELGCRVTAQTISTHLRESANEHVDQDTWDVVFPVK